MQRTTAATNRIVADGIQSTMGTYTVPTSDYPQTLAEKPEGYEGTSIFPARLDHSHPLNVMTTGETGASGNLNDVIKPVGTTGKIGASKYYARQDHEHGMYDNGNAKSAMPFTSPYTRASGSGIWSYTTSSYTSKNAGTNTTNANWAKWSRGLTGNTQAGNICGVDLWVLTGIRKMYGGKSACLYMRKCTFDQNGCLKEIANESFAVEVNTVISS